MVVRAALSANKVLAGAVACHHAAQMVLTNLLISAEAALGAGVWELVVKSASATDGELVFGLQEHLLVAEVRSVTGW